MRGGDDHLAWKRPVSSETYRGLHTVGGYVIRAQLVSQLIRVQLVLLD